MSIIKPVAQESSPGLLEKGKIVASLNSEFRQLTVAYNKLFKSVWENPLVTPQEVFNAFGPDAKQLFTIASAIQSALNTIQPGTITAQPPLPYTIHEDGTVTVGTPE